MLESGSASQEIAEVLVEPIVLAVREFNAGAIKIIVVVFFFSFAGERAGRARFNDGDAHIELIVSIFRDGVVNGLGKIRI